MQTRVVRSMALGVAAALSTVPLAGTAGLAQQLADIRLNLTEDTALIRACRQFNRSTGVFDNTTLGPESNRIGTLGTGVQVRLTGVVQQGRAQVFLAGSDLSPIQPVGWVDAANLTTCGTVTPPPAARVCFRADSALNVRATPTSSAPLVGSYGPGSTIIASTNPPTQRTSPGGAPDFGRIWLEVAIANRTGWVSRSGEGGVGSNITSIACP